MSELRRDPLRGHWSIISAVRSKRPSDFKRAHEPNHETGPCPFCPGNERETPPEVLASRLNDSAADTPGWTIRVVPNKYPALIEPRANAAALPAALLFTRQVAAGTHDIVVATPEHKRHWSQLSVDHWDRILVLVQHRALELWRNTRTKHVTVFINHGAPAGASRAHPHLQIMAMPIVTPVMETMQQRFREHQKGREACLACEVVAGELEDGGRVVSDDLAYATFAPFASRVPYELVIMPRAHRGSFFNVPSGERRRFAVHLRGVFERMFTLLGDVPFNLVLHSASPNEADPRAPFHWHVDIVPRLTETAGLEWGSGAHINPMSPELAAQQLRAQTVHG